jgi:hypothetical protein
LRLISLTIISLLFAAGGPAAFSPAAFAQERSSCSASFAELVSRTSARLPWAAKVAAELELERLLKVKVEEIFPDTQTVRTGRRTTEVRVRDNAAAMRRFRESFDKLWDNRVAAGKVPAWEVKEYRAWLRAQSNSEGAYPPVNAKELFEDYISDGGTIAEYFDFKYLEYLEKVRFTRPENVDEYIRTIDHSILRHWARVGARGAKNFTMPFFRTTLVLTIGVAVTLPFTILNEGLGNALIGQAFTVYLKEKTVQTTEQVRDWGKFFKGGEDEYVSAFLKLATLSYQLDSKNFDEMPRAQVAKELEEFMESTALLLPQFHELVMSEQKDFENRWDTRLNQTKESILVVSTAHQQVRIASDQLKAAIAARGGVASPEELERLSEYTHEMELSADYIASVLADWLFYKQVRGKARPLEPALDRNFATVYERYLRTMGPGRLTKAINARVRAHVSQLMLYSKKVQGLKVDPKSQEIKPEDQIKIESPLEPQ